jgi:cytochrome c oxidase assembly protein Cox11
MKRTGMWIGVTIAVIALAVIGFLVYRYTAPVRVEIVGVADGVPFAIETIPANVVARPGEMVKVTYRITNEALSPLEAYGTITIEPKGATDQMEIFLSQCGGINTYQSTGPEDYGVMFRVQPAGLSGSSRVVLKHTFTPATMR